MRKKSWGGVLNPLAELLPEWKYMGASRALARRYHRRLREQICWSTSCQWMLRETRSSFREGFKIANGMQRNYHNVARCIASTVSWLAVWPVREPVPRNRRGADNSWPWFFPEEMFNGDRWRMSCRHSSELEAVSWQVSCLLRWARPQNSFSPSGESLDKVFHELFHRTQAVSLLLHNQKRLL